MLQICFEKFHGVNASTRNADKKNFNAQYIHINFSSQVSTKHHEELKFIPSALRSLSSEFITNIKRRQKNASICFSFGVTPDLETSSIWI